MAGSESSGGTAGLADQTGLARRDWDREGAAPAVSIRHLYKVFLDDGGAALRMALAGSPKDAVQEATGAVVGVRDISLDIQRGEIFALMGLSGCGKSTLVRCINRLIEPSSGEIWMDGREVTAMGEEELRELRRSDLSMVFQHFGLMPHRNVLENVAMPLEVNGVAKAERKERAEAALQLVGLGDWVESMPSQLSGGMKQRVGLARGLATEAPVMLMDEPFSALDPVIRRDLQEELLALQASVHKTIVFITHDLNEAVRVGDRIGIMRDGDLVQVGAPHEVVLDPVDDFVRDFTKDVRLHGMVTASTIMELDMPTMPGSALVAEVSRELGQSAAASLPCIDADGKYLGSATALNVLQAQRMGVERIEEAMLYVGDTVWEDTVLDDLVSAGLRSQHPLAVLNEEGVLQGVIPLDRLARAMAAEDAEAAGRMQV